MFTKIMLTVFVLFCGYNGYTITYLVIKHSHVTHIMPVARYSPELT